MSDIHVTPSNPRQFDDQFIDLHPALGLKKTSNSGAYWGDGDGRASAKNPGMTFALESKVRLKSHRLAPKAGEFAKAFGEDGTGGQLAKFDSTAIRLFAVYSVPAETYAIQIPENDLEKLEGWGVNVNKGSNSYVRRDGTRLYYRHYPWLDWKDLYDNIESAQN